jgi:hypothetical protein
MNDVFAAALELQAVCQTHHWRFCFIGEKKIAQHKQPFTRIKRTRRGKS